MKQKRPARLVIGICAALFVCYFIPRVLWAYGDKDTTAEWAAKRESMYHEVVNCLQDSELQVYGIAQHNWNQPMLLFLDGPDAEEVRTALEDTYGGFIIFTGEDELLVSDLSTQNIRSDGYRQWHLDRMKAIEDMLLNSDLDFRFKATRTRHDLRYLRKVYSLHVLFCADDPDVEAAADLLDGLENVTYFISKNFAKEAAGVQYSAGYSGERK